MLQGGDRRSLGAAGEVLEAVRRDPARFEELWACISHGDPLVRMRAADALEKLSRENPAPFAAHKSAILDGSLDDGTAEVRWHVIPIAARLPLTDAESETLFAYIDGRVRSDPSRIVKAEALQAAAAIHSRHPRLRAAFLKLLTWARSSPWPSLRARARKISLES
jgi:hypothetical protein